LQECLARELREELGVHAKVGEVLTESKYRYAHGEFVIKALEADIGQATPRLTVHDEIRWLGPEQILDLALAPADIPIAHYLHRIRCGN
jgi:8-oxo-dGTP diphosphatase